jgi:hypothetical protein
MKKSVTALLVFVLIAGFSTIAHAGLDDFLARLNERALSDVTHFNAQISAQFGIPIPKVHEVMRHMPSPADGFMVFQLSLMTSKPPETVVKTFEKHNGKGWGVIAKDLGIKPGSREFHQLKRGDFELTGKPVEYGSGHGKGHGEGKEHGHGKGKGHDD